MSVTSVECMCARPSPPQNFDYIQSIIEVHMWGFIYVHMYPKHSTKYGDKNLEWTKPQFLNSLFNSENIYMCKYTTFHIDLHLIHIY